MGVFWKRGFSKILEDLLRIFSPTQTAEQVSEQVKVDPSLDSGNLWASHRDSEGRRRRGPLWTCLSFPRGRQGALPAR